MPLLPGMKNVNMHDFIMDNHIIDVPYLDCTSSTLTRTL